MGCIIECMLRVYVSMMDDYGLCMMVIFSDIMEMSIEAIMDDFLVVGATFDKYIDNLKLVLKRCEETKLVLN